MVGLTGAPASIPKRSGRTARFTGASAASRPGRAGFSHCTPRRYIGVGKAHDCPYQPGEGVHPDRQTPEPLVLGALPGIPLSGPVVAASGEDTLRIPTDLLRDALNIHARQKPASADVSSAYATFVGAVWRSFGPHFGTFAGLSTRVENVEKRRRTIQHGKRESGRWGEGELSTGERQTRRRSARQRRVCRSPAHTSPVTTARSVSRSTFPPVTMIPTRVPSSSTASRLSPARPAAAAGSMRLCVV